LIKIVAFHHEGATVYTEQAEMWHVKVYYAFCHMPIDGWDESVWPSCRFCNGLAMLKVSSSLESRIFAKY